MQVATALEKLRWHHANQQAIAQEEYEAGVPVVGVWGSAMPYEIVRAAGCFPVVLDTANGAAPLATDWSFLKLLIIPPSLSLFGIAKPPHYLYDGHSDGLRNTQALAQRLTEISGRAIDDDVLKQAVEESNAARAAIRQLLRLRRRSRPKLSGTEALAIISAWNFMERTEFTELVGQALTELKHRPSLHGMRLLVKGLPLQQNELYRAIEIHGAIVVAEDDWHGSRSAGRDIALGKDLLACIYRKYYSESGHTRETKDEDAAQWFQREALLSIDGVVFCLPSDDVPDSDYQRQKQFLDEHHIPNLLVRENVTSDGVSSEIHQQLKKFIRGIAWRQ